MSKLAVLLTMTLSFSSALYAQDDEKIYQEVRSYQSEVANLNHFGLAEALNLNAASMIYRCGKDFFYGLYNAIRSQTLSLSVYNEYLTQARMRNTMCLTSTLRFKIVTDEITERNSQALSQISSDTSLAAKEMVDRSTDAAINKINEANQGVVDMAKEAAQITQEKAAQGWQYLKKQGQELINPKDDDAAGN